MMKMSIKPVSALRDYNKLLKEVDADNPVFLTKMVMESMQLLILKVMIDL